MSSAAETKPHKKMGRPLYEPTEKDRRTVEAMAGHGFKHEEIGGVIGVDAKTLRKHFRHELDTSAVRMLAKVAECVFLRATDMRSTRNGGNPQASITAAIWIEKTRGGRTDRVRTEVTGKDGGPIRTVDVTKLTDEELAAIVAGSAATGGGGTRT